MDLRELRASPACAITDRNQSANAISQTRTAAIIANGEAYRYRPINTTRAVIVRGGVGRAAVLVYILDLYWSCGVSSALSRLNSAPKSPISAPRFIC